MLGNPNDQKNNTLFLIRIHMAVTILYSNSSLPREKIILYIKT